MDGGNQHTAGFSAHHFTGRQVSDGHQGLADQVLGFVEFGNAGQDLTVSTGAIVQGELQQLIALLNRLDRKSVV